MTKEFEMTFAVDGVNVGSAFFSVEDGRLDTASLEDEFHAIIRKNKKDWLEEAADEERTELIDNLSDEDEEKLKEAHMSQYNGSDDDSPDDYENWMTDLSVDEIKKILN